MISINYLKHFLDTQDGLILYLLGVMCFLMVVDFLTGITGAYINPNIEFKSKEGINGILRKFISLIVAITVIPISVLVPNDMGLSLIHTLYIGYIFFEFKSIIENLDKCGIKVGLFKIFLNGIEKNISNTIDSNSKLLEDKEEEPRDDEKTTNISSM